MCDLGKLNKEQRPSRYLYELQLQNIPMPEGSKSNWEVETGQTISDQEWKSCLPKKGQLTSAKLQSFCMLFVHRKYWSNPSLIHIGMSQSPACARCGELETLTRLYWECPLIQSVWHGIERKGDFNPPIDTPLRALLGLGCE